MEARKPSGLPLLLGDPTSPRWNRHLQRKAAVRGSGRPAHTPQQEGGGRASCGRLQGLGGCKGKSRGSGSNALSSKK